MNKHSTHQHLRINTKKQILLTRHNIGLFFLGVGMTMFLVNITTMLTVAPYLKLLNVGLASLPLAGYYISVLSSVFLMGYSLYNIYVEEE
ncbi:MAG: hypothetical protein H6500_03510 [Candidatus Woesearchaeota archaeon]|nr:MAG: hypothetical protein H6500_03510 [Candidatus Woesearchaeota archaeon]